MLTKGFKTTEFWRGIILLSLLACYVLGIDIGQILLYITDQEQWVKDMHKLITSANSGAEAWVFAAAILGEAVYTSGRNYLKGKTIADKPVDETVAELLAKIEELKT